MPRQPPLSTNEVEFIQAALKDGIRVDGRQPADMRKLVITIEPAANGVVQVQLGKTR